MDNTKLIKGQVWISGDSLLQDQILILPNGTSSTNTVPLINNIWEDLLSEGGQYKTNKKGYFYWEAKMTDVENNDVEVTVMIECPRPKDGLFEEPYDPEKGKGEWAKYWLTKYKTTAENALEKMTIQKKEIVFPGTEYINQYGELVKVEEKRVTNDNLGDISNLLSMF